jgi:hypothetical protein
VCQLLSLRFMASSIHHEWTGGAVLC